MPGLLDLLNNDDARFGIGLLAAAGPSMQPMGFGQRLQGALGSFDDYKKDQARSKLFDTQLQAGMLNLERAKRDDAQEQQIADAARAAYVSPEMANAASMGPLAPQVAPGLNAQEFLGKVYGINPIKAMQYQATLAKDESPLTVAPGASLVDRRTMKPIYTAPKDVAPTEVAKLVGEMRQLPPDSPLRAVYENAIKKATTHQPGTNVNLAVNTEKNLLGDIAGGLSKSLVEARSGAQSALGTIGTVNRLMDALDTNKVMAGPGTTFRQYGLQVGNLLGVSGKDANEKMLNTRQAIQSLAQLELDAAQQMKGQGQITEAERSIIRRAASGDIDSMTTGELRLLGGVLDRTARSKIQGYNSQVKPLLSNPNAAPIAPFLNVEEPGARQQPNVLRFDAQGNPVR